MLLRREVLLIFGMVKMSSPSIRFRERAGNTHEGYSLHMSATGNRLCPDDFPKGLISVFIFCLSIDALLTSRGTELSNRLALKIQ